MYNHQQWAVKVPYRYRKVSGSTSVLITILSSLWNLKLRISDISNEAATKTTDGSNNGCSSINKSIISTQGGDPLGGRAPVGGVLRGDQRDDRVAAGPHDVPGDPGAHRRPRPQRPLHGAPRLQAAREHQVEVRRRGVEIR